MRQTLPKDFKLVKNSTIYDFFHLDPPMMDFHTKAISEAIKFNPSISAHILSMRFCILQTSVVQHLNAIAKTNGHC